MKRKNALLASVVVSSSLLFSSKIPTTCGLSFSDDTAAAAEALLFHTKRYINPDTPQEQRLSKYKPMNSAQSFANFLMDESSLQKKEESNHNSAIQGTTTTKKKSTSKVHHEKSEQVVFVNFNNGGTFDIPIVEESTNIPFPGLTLFGLFGIDPLQDYEYTEADKEFILERLRHDYASFNFKFVTTEPTNGIPFSTLTFNDNDDSLDGGPGVTINAEVNSTDGSLIFTTISIGFGLADGIDFLNRNSSDNAGIDASYWILLHFLDPSGEELSLRTGIPLDGSNGPEEILRLAVITQSANTAAHELGHLVGLRHHDSFGPIGSGLPDTGVPNAMDFVPVYTGPNGADESILHILASGASVGLPQTFSANFDRFFSERSAIKIVLSEEEEGSKFLRSEEDFVRHMQKKGPLRMKRLRFPNTVDIGNNAGDDDELEVDAVVISGRIAEGELDTYEFSLRSGHRILNAEVISFAGLPPFSDDVISRLRLIRKTTIADSFGKIVSTKRTEIALNFQTFEGFDPLILDAEILPPNDGLDNTTTTYIIEVGAPDLFIVGGIIFSFKATGLESFLTGDYQLLVYSARRRLSDDSRQQHQQNQQKNKNDGGRL